MHHRTTTVVAGPFRSLLETKGSQKLRHNPQELQVTSARLMSLEPAFSKQQKFRRLTMPGHQALMVRSDVPQQSVA
jgi:hypothetical protein